MKITQPPALYIALSDMDIALHGFQGEAQESFQLGPGWKMLRSAEPKHCKRETHPTMLQGTPSLLHQGITGMGR